MVARRLWISLGIASICIASARPGMCADLPTLEANAIQARQSIRSGHVTTQATWFDVAADGTRTVKLDVKRESWFDGSSVRVDTTRPVNYRVANGPLHRVLQCRHKGKYSSWAGDRTDNEHPIVLTYRNLAELPADDWLSQIYDVRKLGFMPAHSDMLYDREIGAFTIKANRSDIQIEDDVFDGFDCTKVSYKLKDPAVAMRVWYAKDRGNNLIGMECEFAQFRDTVTTKLSAHTSKKIIFPKKVTFERRVKGQLTEVEEAILTVHQLNEPVPESTFTFAGFGLPNGLRVNDFTTDKYLVWNGSEVVAQSPERQRAESKPLAPVEVREPGKTSNVWLYVLCAGIGVAVLLVLYRIRAYYATRTL